MLPIPHLRRQTHSRGIVAFSKSHVIAAILSAGSFAVVSFLFLIAGFSFGYLLGFYFYTMILGYLWIVSFAAFLQPCPGNCLHFRVRAGVPYTHAVYYVSD